MTSAAATKCLSAFPLPPRATAPQSYQLTVMTCLIIYTGEVNGSETETARDSEEYGNEGQRTNRGADRDRSHVKSDTPRSRPEHV